MNTERTQPIYAQIANDIAIRIARNELKEGSKVTGRSTLASEYKVSPETIRRALFLLEDKGILQILQGSGDTILSREKASIYVETQKSSQSILDLKNSIADNIREKNKLEKNILSSLDKIIDYCERLKNSNPIYPLEFEIPSNSPLIGKLAKDVSFWQQTGGTIVGIRRGDNIIISPGPFATFEKKDVLLVVGNPTCYEKVLIFLEYGI